MLFKQRFWPGIADGTVTLTFRRWKRPMAKVGSRHVFPGGSITIDAIDVVEPGSITARQARQAGFADLGELLTGLERYAGDLYRVRFHYAGDDPRVALRADDALGDADIEQLVARLARLDGERAWTHETLQLIADNPGVRAADLAAELGREKLDFKIDVRKLKALGLTESLPLGYRLSPRGQALLDRLR
jgi:hypothetical protein